MRLDPKVRKWAGIALREPAYFGTILRQRVVKSLAIDYRFGNGRSSGPSSIYATLTWRCNLRCEMCEQYGDDYKRQRVANNGCDELSLEDWKRIVDETAHHRPHYNLYGGEPLLYEGAVELARHVVGRGLPCSLTTNGMLLERHADALVAAGLEHVGVSVDGPPEVHDRIRGRVGSFERLARGITALRAARKARCSNKPYVSINFTISLGNHDRVGEMAAVSRALGGDSLNVTHLHFLRPEAMREHKQFFRERFGYEWSERRKRLSYLPTDRIDCAVLAEQLEHLRRDPFPVAFLPELTDQADIEGYYHDMGHRFERSFCLNPWKHVSISPRGTVMPCTDYPVGDLREESFEAIWNGPRFQAYRRALRERGLFPGTCLRCTHRRYRSTLSTLRARYL